jgi:hypothetical protein
MTANKDATGQPSPHQPHPVRLPGFMMPDEEEEVGLGEVIKRATAAVGIRPCSGCQRRAQALDRRVVFRRRHA